MAVLQLLYWYLGKNGNRLTAFQISKTFFFSFHASNVSVDCHFACEFVTFVLLIKPFRYIFSYKKYSCTF